MPHLDHRFLAVIQELEGDLLLGEPLFFPELSCLARSRIKLAATLRRRVSEAAAELDPGDLYCRRLVGAPQTGSIDVTLEPLRNDPTWRNTVRLRFDYVWWRHGTEAVLAYFPALGIEVLVGAGESPSVELSRQVHCALVRLRVTQSLRRLVWLQQVRRVSIETLSVSVKVRSPKQRAVKREAADQTAASVLRSVATDLCRRELSPAFEVEHTLTRLADALGAKRPTSVLLVGSSGVGKTAAVHEFVRRRREFELGGTPFWSTSGSRLVAGMSGFGMWQQRCQNLVREASKSKAIVHIDNLVELMDVGKHVGNQQGIASFLRPHLNRGELVAIAECTPEQLPLIEREDPLLLDVFQQVHVEEPSPEVALSILLSFVGRESQGRTVEFGSLETLDRLHRRYATYSAFPGRPLRFLRNLLEDRTTLENRSDASPGERHRTIRPADVTAAFSRETGLPQFLLDEAAELRLAETRRWFASRVLGQTQPVDLVVELLATIKAGLSRPGRPIASFLFVGPTGVGKTEMAKALSEFMYSDPGRLVRFDMSEYADRGALDRLIGGSYSCRGLLTDRVRQQPFTVVLLDEFEKAHPAFFDLLLQVLGEGRLTDGAGRVADFSNSIVIMTSNLGAETFGRGTVGFNAGDLVATGAEQHFERQVRAFVRPEFYNRIDRIVPFAPLDLATIKSVARRELANIRSREGIRFRHLTLDVGEEAMQFLAVQGYEPRYGARPLKRALEQRLVTPLAHRLSSYEHSLPISAEATLRDGQIALDVRVHTAARAANRPPSGDAPNDGLLALSENVTALRRMTQALTGSSKLKTLENELYRMEQLLRHLEERRGAAHRIHRYGPEVLRMQQVSRLLDRARSLASGVEEIEDELLFAIYSLDSRPGDSRPGSTSADRPDLGELRERHALATADLDQLLLDLHLLDNEGGGRVTLAFFSRRVEWMLELAQAYVDVARGRGWTLTVYSLRVARADRKPVATFRLKHRPTGPDEPVSIIADAFRHSAPEELFGTPPDDLLGVGVEIQGPLAIPLLSGEVGLHERNETSEEYCVLEAFSGMMFGYEPPPGIDRVRFFSGQLPTTYALRRRYRFREERVEDMALDTTFPVIRGRLGPVIARAIDLHFRQNLLAILDL